MQPRRTFVASLSSALIAVAVLGAWVAFAPPRLGGQTSYVILSGNSMEPGMYRGDLAVVRRSSSYDTGDVVTYRHPQIGPVIHRIIEREGSRYVFQGDNNDFVDPYRPVSEELIGELWFRVPGAGSWLVRFKEPAYMLGLLFVAFIGIGGAKATAESRNSRRRRGAVTGAATPMASSGGRPMNPLLRNWQDTVAVIAAAGLALVALGWMAFNRPTQETVAVELPYTQSGEFSYTAVPVDGRVYDSGVAASGEPVYRRLSDQVAFRFDYAFIAVAEARVSGRYHLLAEVGDQNGWRRTIELSPMATFAGSEFTAEGTLDFREVQALIAILEEQSGVRNEKYSVVIRPEVQLSGSVDAAPFEGTFAPELRMALDRVQLRMDPRPETKTPLAPRAEGLVSAQERDPAEIRLLVASIPVSLARVVSLAGLGGVLAFAGWFLLVATNRRTVPGVGVAGTNLRSPLVNVRGTVPAPQRVVDIASLDDLGRIAAGIGAVVLQEARPGYHAYFVHDLNITYRFEAVGGFEEHSTEPFVMRRTA